MPKACYRFRYGWSCTGLQIRSLTIGEAMLSDDAIKEVASWDWEWGDDSDNKYLLYKHGELSSDPQQSREKPGVMAPPSNPIIGN